MSRTQPPSRADPVSGKYFANPADPFAGKRQRLGRALHHMARELALAQRHIQQLERDNARLRERVTRLENDKAR
jgi:hypothetical protein